MIVLCWYEPFPCRFASLQKRSHAELSLLGRRFDEVWHGTVSTDGENLPQADGKQEARLENRQMVLDVATLKPIASSRIPVVRL
jgi:hypothetical protein